MAGDLFMFFNKSKKYIDIVNTKGGSVIHMMKDIPRQLLISLF